MLDSIQKELKYVLRSETRELNVVVMPDFFLDRIISLNHNVDSFSKIAYEIVKRKGGSIDGIEQTDLKGGNAINTASALAALGAKVTPIVCTSKAGLRFLKFYMRSHNVDLSHIKILEKPSVTTALEFKIKNEKANVMLRNLGSLENFEPQYLNKNDFEVVEDADYVCVFNWAGTRQNGTELAKTVFQHVKKKGKGRTYYDTADPMPNKEKIPELTKTVLQSREIDVLSVNENEAICYAAQFSSRLKKPKKRLRFDELAKEAARTLASYTSARVDLHTTSFAATFTKRDEVIAPAFKVQVLRTTGAGDAWNAGNILGDYCKLSHVARLTLANAVAAYYISHPSGAHPTRMRLTRFLEKAKTKKILCNTST